MASQANSGPYLGTSAPNRPRQKPGQPGFPALTAATLGCDRETHSRALPPSTRRGGTIPSNGAILSANRCSLSALLPGGLLLQLVSVEGLHLVEQLIELLGRQRPSFAVDQVPRTERHEGRDGLDL